ncbi:MAG: N-acetylmuramoyl-L-alanine amidase [Actinobacteria bacterium]|nr:N-acetylmuramoyl-L-alanine amidase [Actinomycetota bacterium]
MSSPRVVIAALALALLVAAPAAGGVSLVTRDVPLAESAGLRPTGQTGAVLSARTAPIRFNLVGLHWQGSGDVSFRTASLGGSWSAWRPGRPEAEDLPDAGTFEAQRRAGWKLGNPFWTGSARRIQYRLSGRVTRLRAHFVWSAVTGAPPRARRLAGVAPAQPAIVTRADWQADESIVRATPSYADRLAFAAVHHTAGGVPASPAQSAAMVRGIHTYHVRSNGWNDIGYSFLVDPFGQVFEGRAGGMTRNVIGAHAQGFNTGSVGVAVLGTYEAKTIAPAAREALAGLLAWRLDVGHADAAATLTRISGGSSKWAAGTPVELRTVSGHRDLGLTACPGELLYGELDLLASDVAARGLPKIYDPWVDGSVGEIVRFSARLSEALPWTVTVFGASGSVVASGSGAGKLVDWRWDARGALPSRYTYAIETPGARPVREPLGGAAPLDLTTFIVKPPVFSPNGDGVDDNAELRLTSTTAAGLDVWLENAVGSRVATLYAGGGVEAGPNTLRWGGKSRGGQAVADGRYTVVAEASIGTERVSRRASVTVDRTLGHLTVRPAAFSPNGDGRRDLVAIEWQQSRQANVRVRILAGSRVVATLASGSRPASRVTLDWTGRGVADGRYSAVVEATSSLGTRRLSETFVRDTTAPRVTGLSARRQRRGTFVRFWVSEPARVAVVLGGRTLRFRADKGRVELWRRTRPAFVTVAAGDMAENGSASKRVRVRRPDSRAGV